MNSLVQTAPSGVSLKPGQYTELTYFVRDNTEYTKGGDGFFISGEGDFLLTSDGYKVTKIFDRGTDIMFHCENGLVPRFLSKNSSMDRKALSPMRVVDWGKQKISEIF